MYSKWKKEFRKIKRFIAFLIVVIFFISIFDPVSAAPLFKDVGDKYPAKAEISFLASKGIIMENPEGNFGVDQETTRLEAAEMIVRSLGIETTDQLEQDFADVDSNHPGYPFMTTLVNRGIMHTDENGAFNPDAPFTRGESAVFLMRAFELKGTTKTPFVDVLPEYWVSEAIKTLQANNIATDYPDHTYKPLANITKVDFVVLLARILHPEFREVPALPLPLPEVIACEKPSKVKTFKVNVQVMSLWHTPNIARAVDRPSIWAPVDMTKWTKDMNLKEKWWLVNKTDTQALYGDEVTILQKSGNWYKVAIKDQYVPYLKEGYPGWVPKSQIAETTTDYTTCSIAIVSAKTSTLYNDKNKKNSFINISYSTILPIVKEDGEWLVVQTPANGVKYLLKKDAKTYKNYAAIPKPSQKDIVDSAKAFIGLPYLWAGTSSYGFDCSGIIYSVYKNHGILIPRDSFYQATKETPVAKNNLQPGDLVFFAGNNGKGKVYHVRLYIGDGKMLHAPDASSKVRIESISAGVFKTRYAGARRYLK